MGQMRLPAAAFPVLRSVGAAKADSSDTLEVLL